MTVTALERNLERLEHWVLGTGIAKSWNAIRIAEEADIYDDAELGIDTGVLKTPAGYSKRFTELVDAGYSWVHLNALGTIGETRVVTVRWPEVSTGIKGRTSVNLSHELPRDLSRFVVV